jgi:hypothetical protein
LHGGKAKKVGKTSKRREKKKKLGKGNDYYVLLQGKEHKTCFAFVANRTRTNLTAAATAVAAWEKQSSKRGFFYQS